MVDTKKSLRREVNYHSLDDIVDDAQRLVAAEASTTGNWSVGRILEHLARTMDISLDGTDLKAPWLIRFFLGNFIMKKRVLHNKMSPGYRLPPKVDAALVSEEVDAQAALEHLQQAVERLKQETHREPSPFLGPMTVEEWDLLHCRHSELHMSFIQDVAANA